MRLLEAALIARLPLVVRVGADAGDAAARSSNSVQTASVGTRRLGSLCLLNCAELQLCQICFLRRLTNVLFRVGPPASPSWVLISQGPLVRLGQHLAASAIARCFTSLRVAASLSTTRAV